MDVEGLINLEDYVPPENEKQIAKLPKYEMDPRYWQIDDPPPYEELEEEIEGGDKLEGEEDERKANKILDHLDLPNYDDVEKVLNQEQMTPTKQRNYLNKVVTGAQRRRRQVIAMKSAATKKFNKGEIDENEKLRIHNNSDKFRGELNGYIKQYKFKGKTIKGVGVMRGRGVFFYNDAKELLKKLALIVGEMEAGNTSIKMRNTGQSILDALLRSKAINKAQYGKLVKKYFKI